MTTVENPALVDVILFNFHIRDLDDQIVMKLLFIALYKRETVYRLPVN